MDAICCNALIKLLKNTSKWGTIMVKCSLINCSLERAMAFIVTRNKILQKSNLFLLFSYLFFIMYHANQIRVNTGIIGGFFTCLTRKNKSDRKKLYQKNTDCIKHRNTINSIFLVSSSISVWLVAMQLCTHLTDLLCNVIWHIKQM